MGVLKNLQNLSDLEFYKCAEKLQDDIRGNVWKRRKRKTPRLDAAKLRQE